MVRRMIYAMQAGDNGPVKIGIAINPASRLRELQTGNPQALRIVEKIDAPDRQERFLHERLKEHRIRGEWFNPHPEVFGVLKSAKVCALLGKAYDDGLCPDCNMGLAYGLWIEDHDHGPSFDGLE